MAKVSTNLSIDADLKKAAQELFSDLGMDLSTAFSIFLKQAIRVQGMPFVISRNENRAETIEAILEFYAMKLHPEQYKRYSSFKSAMEDVLSDEV